jgi:hypothetical protein
LRASPRRLSSSRSCSCLPWAPLESADHGAATRLNSLVVGHSALVAVLGVHYLSEVLGAFELSRHAGGQPGNRSGAEGLEPYARADLKPT